MTQDRKYDFTQPRNNDKGEQLIAKPSDQETYLKGVFNMLLDCKQWWDSNI